MARRNQFQSTYEPEKALAICERIAEGETLSAICRKQGMPTRQTFHRWVVKYPELSRAYSAARELSAHSLEEEALDTARELKDPKKRKRLAASEVRALDVSMGQLRWSASRRNPRVYSEKGAVSVSVPIQINTSLDLAATADEGDAVYRLEARTVNPLEKEQTDHGEEAAKVEDKDGNPLKPLLTRKEQRAARRRPQEEADNARDGSDGTESA